MSQRLRELLVFGVLFALPFASAAVVEWWATFLPVVRRREDAR